MMSIKFKKSVMFKKDSQGNGIIFSVEDSEDTYLKLNGIALLVSQQLIEGISLEEIKKSILNEYSVSEHQIDKDISGLKNILDKHGFLEK